MGKTTKMRQRGTLTLPNEIRRELGLEEGDEIDVEVDAAGRLILTPLARIPKSAAWFYTPEWRKRILEAEEDLAAGRYRDFDSVEDLLLDLPVEDPTE
jgi:AbrB family looped-hinge helix DNA binding protein